jgi:hypothetical protein
LVELSADGALFDARRLSVPAGRSGTLTLDDLPYDLRVLRARLVFEEGEGDHDRNALPLDDVAWAVHAPPVSGRVLLVSAGNLFLERALGALPGVELTRLAPDRPLPAEPYDLYVYDGSVTPTLPSGNLWLVGPPGSADDGFSIRVGGTFTVTEISRVAQDDVLLRYVDLGAVHVRQARAVEPPPEARVLVESPGGPLLFVAQRPEGRLAVLAFDLRDSDLPLQVAFPVLTANLVGWLLPGGTARLPALVRPGDPVPMQPDPAAAEILVTAPDGTRHALAVGDDPPVFAATDRLGVYRVEYLDRSGAVLQSGALTVNLFDEAESDIAPREVVRVGRTEVPTAARGEEGRREFWPWLAGAALGALAVEWWAYQRRSLRLGKWRTV